MMLARPVPALVAALLTPFAPVALAAVAAPAPAVDGTDLVWAPVDAISINVHRGDGGYVTTLPGTATRWTATAPGDWFLVGADHGDWREWGRSPTVRTGDGGSGTPSPVATPPAPVDLRAEVYSPRSLELFWRRPEGTPPDAVFELYRNGLPIGETRGTSAFLDDVRPGLTFAYAVRVRAEERTSPAATVRVRTDDGPVDPTRSGLPVNRAPTRPTDLAVEGASEDVIALSWTAAEDPDGAIAGYDVFRDLEYVGRRTAEPQNGAARFVDTGLAPGTAYRYEVSAVDDDGESGAPALLVARTFGASATDLSPGGSLLAPDCLVATGEGLAFCYSPATRELSARFGDGRTYWRFALPNPGGANEVRGLAFAGGRLVVVARVGEGGFRSAGRDDEGGEWEFSAFEPDGAFVETFGLPVALLPGHQTFPADSVAVTGGPTGLYVATVLVGATDGADGSVAATGGPLPAEGGLSEAVAMRFDVRTGARVGYRRLGEVAPGATLAMSTSDGGTPIVAVDGARRALDPLSLADAAAPDGFDADARDTARALASNAADGDFLALARDAFSAYRGAELAVTDIDAEGRNVYACPGGGTVTAITGTVEGRGTGERFEACRVAGWTIDGTVGELETFAGGRLGGTTRSVEAWQGFEAVAADGTRVALDGEREQTYAYSFGTVCGGQRRTTIALDFGSVDATSAGVRTRLDGLDASVTVGSVDELYPVGDGFACRTVPNRTARLSAALTSDALGGVPATVRVESGLQEAVDPDGPVEASFARTVRFEDGTGLADALVDVGASTVEARVSTAGGETVRVEAAPLD